MDKTLQTMVGATETIFFAGATVVHVVVKTVCITQTNFSIPQTIVFSNEKMFLTAATIFLVNRKMV